MTVVYLWRIRKRSLFFALMHMALDRFSLARISGVSFYKSIGTGTGERFTPSDADVTLWGLIVQTDSIETLDSSSLVKRWRKIAIAEERIAMQAISSHGKWAGLNPFPVAPRTTSDERIVAITRARIKWSMNRLFWRSVPPVTQSLHSQPGLIQAIGIGEAPIGLQGTLSVWKDSASLRAFAYQGDEHSRVIQATKEHDWYSEELFARFAVVEIRGSIGGVNTAE